MKSFYKRNFLTENPRQFVSLSFWLLVLATSLVAAAAQAQDKPPASGGGGGSNVEDALGQTVSSAVKDQLNFDDPSTAHLTNAFNGWLASEFNTSPILFDPKLAPDQKRIYPENADCTQTSKVEGTNAKPACGPDGERPSLMKMNLGVNDELKKTSMAMYQPIEELVEDNAKSEIKRDNFLGLYDKIFSLAVLSLGMLDKGVQSGLASSQQLIDNSIQQHIQKQILWTTSRIANPHRTVMYADMDEKFEKCLTTIKESVGAGGGSGSGGECEEQCGKKPEEYGKGQQSGQGGSQQGGGAGGGDKPAGAYAWCVCCAEVSKKVNLSTSPESETIKCSNGGSGGAGGGDNECFSLVDRVFYGVRAPQGGGAGGGESTELLKNVVWTFKETYGDIVYKAIEDSSGSGSGSGNTTWGEHIKLDDSGENNTVNKPDGRFDFEWIYPVFSAPLKLKAFRDGCTNCSGEDCPPAQLACPITGLKIEFGICPALAKLISEWPTIKSQVGQNELKDISVGGSTVRKLWVEASLGGIITAQHIESIIALNAQEGQGGDQNKIQIVGNIQLWLDTYCDAAALAAFKRFHLRMKSITLDHMAINQKASDYEKGKVRSLLGRLDEFFQLAEMDENADNNTAILMSRAAEAKNKQNLAYIQSNQASLLAAQDQASKQQGGLNLFGWNASFGEGQ